jgi:hypothetical protein
MVGSESFKTVHRSFDRVCDRVCGRVCDRVCDRVCERVAVQIGTFSRLSEALQIWKAWRRQPVHDFATACPSRLRMYLVRFSFSAHLPDMIDSDDPRELHMWRAHADKCAPGSLSKSAHFPDLICASCTRGARTLTSAFLVL